MKHEMGNRNVIYKRTVHPESNPSLPHITHPPASWQVYQLIDLTDDIQLQDLHGLEAEAHTLKITGL